LADDTYAILDDVTSLSWNATALPMNWISVDVSTQSILPAAKYILETGYANRFSTDAFRALWRVSVDAQWYESADALAYLEDVSTYIARFDEDIPTTITAGGVQGAQSDILSVKAGYLSALMWGGDQQLAQRYYNKHFVQAYDFDMEQWNDGTDYYDANWAWFASALYNRKFTNLWETSLAQ
jgi:hypothetical protein